MSGKRLPRILLGVLAAFTLALTAACTEEKEQAGQQTAVPTQTASAGTATTPTLVPTAAAEQTKPVSNDTPVPPPLTNTPSPSPKEVYVTSPDGLRVRAGPGLGFDIITTAPMYTQGTVVEGPIEADGFVWWKVKTEDTAEGWCAGDWLEFGTPPPAPECDFSKPMALRPATTYDIFGQDEFDTLVCGYLITREEMAWEELQTNAYLVVVDYADENFIQAVDAGIQMGNGVNKKGPLYYEFNLGCYEDERIKGIEHGDGNPYIDPQTESAILSSTPENPVSLVLSFGYHPGWSCVCCNLAHKIRLY